MSEWWTYRLTSFLLFSPRTYYRTIERYNLEIWPGAARRHRDRARDHRAADGERR
jgi:hypothetical protein